jgi:hypothetical protein
MGRPNKLGGITPKRLVYPIGCAITENGCGIYRNRVCENWLPIYTDKDLKSVITAKVQEDEDI